MGAGQLMGVNNEKYKNVIYMYNRIIIINKRKPGNPWSSGAVAWSGRLELQWKAVDAKIAKNDVQKDVGGILTVNKINGNGTHKRIR